MNLIKQLEQRSQEHPERIALIDVAGELSYGELYAEVCHGSEFLRQQGFKLGDCILIVEPINIGLYIRLLSIFHAGMTAIIIDPSTKKSALRSSLQLSVPDGFIGSAKAHLLRVTIPEIRKIKRCINTSGFVPLSKRWKSNKKEKRVTEPSAVGLDHPALITFTSGSTGMPKAACRSHGFLLAQHEALAESLDFKAGEVDLITLPIFAIANLASGMTSVIADTDLRYPAQADPVKINAQCREHKVTRCAASPAFFRKLFEDGIFPLFRTIYTGGAPVFPHLIDAIQSKYPDLNIVTVYGSTEAEPISHIAWDEVSEADHVAMKRGEGLLVGTAVSATDLMICESDFSDTIGEIAVAGDHVLKGYLHGKGDAETKFQKDGEIWHRTGDMGYLDKENRLWLMGRTSAVFKVGDRVVYPFSIECAVLHHHLVERCAVVEHGGKFLLCLELNGQGQGLEQVKADFAEYEYLEIIQLETVPMDKRHNAKVDYPELEKILSRLDAG